MGLFDSRNKELTNEINAIFQNIFNRLDSLEKRLTKRASYRCLKFFISLNKQAAIGEEYALNEASFVDFSALYLGNKIIYCHGNTLFPATLFHKDILQNRYRLFVRTTPKFISISLWEPDPQDSQEYQPVSSAGQLVECQFPIESFLHFNTTEIYSSGFKRQPEDCKLSSHGFEHAFFYFGIDMSEDCELSEPEAKPEEE